ncbi:hypothetical protein [Psychrobacillus antarcticus]|uniref:hypothetical protein n=1 Tax=Psychrobacillus antarcticus TaxID=2879115 RepID=UPI0024082731|nr:hypothetical protein [Psychrobacillus antarcticus]
MDKIVYTLEFDDDAANSRANDLLQKGWTLLHVGTKMIDTLNNGQAYYNTTYVVGANQEQYELFEIESSKESSLESLIKKLED